MQQPCPNCGSMIDANSRFCTNCGAVREIPSYRQSWEAPPAQSPTQVPPWAQAQGGMYQQQVSTYNQPGGDSLGFGGQSDANARRLLIIAVSVILGALLLLIICIALALVVPIPSLRVFFLIVAILLILIPWIIYTRIRRLIRRSVGRFWWFM